MRQGVGSLNRTWLAIIGLVGILLGAVGLLLATGLAAQVAPAVGIDAPAQPSDPAVPGDVETMFDSPAVAVITAVVGVLLAVLALAWIVAQIPRRNAARPLRLHDDGSDGLTMCRPEVITDAVEHQIEGFPGVLGAKAVLRGTASAPELTVNVTVDERADVQEVLYHVHGEAVTDLEKTLDVSLRRLGVLVDVSAQRKSDKVAVL